MNLPAPITEAGTVQDNERIGHLPQALQDALRAAYDLALSSHSDATRSAYERGFADFSAWCSEFDLAPLPAHAASVAGYLASLVDRKLRPSTIAGRVAAISFAHRHEPDDPTKAATVRAIIKGIKNKLGTRAVKKAPLTDALVAKTIKRMPNTLIGSRDKALVLLGFAAALRRSELVGLDVEHIERRPEGIILRIAKSKGDQQGKGQIVAVPNGSKLRPVEALNTWLKEAGIRSGPLFRGVAKGGRLLPDRLSDRQVARIVKIQAKRLRLDPDLFSGHSLRSGYATTAGRADLAGTAAHLRHAKIDTTRGYIQEADAFANHSGRKFL